MAAKVRVYAKMFSGNLTDEQAQRILKIRNSPEIPAMKNEIYNFKASFCKEARSLDKTPYDLAVERGILEENRGELRDYQTVGAAFMVASPRSILGDAAGIGKTPQVCAMLNKLRKMNAKSGKETKRVLVSAETSAVGQIAREIERFTGMRAVVLSSLSAKMVPQVNKFYITHEVANTPRTPKSYDFEILVVTHATLRSDTFLTWFSRVLHLFDTFILDESHVVKTPSATISEYTRIICSKMERVHFLNATVFETKLMEVYNQFELCYPGLLPPKSFVEQHFCKFKKVQYFVRGGGGAQKYKWDLVGYKNQEAFCNALSLVYLTRKKKDVKLSETQRTYQVYLIPQAKHQRTLIMQGYRYFEVLNCPSLCEDAGVPNSPKTVPKMARLLELVQDNYEGQNLVIYVWHLEVQQDIKYMLERIGRKVAVMNGSTTDKDTVREDFNEGKYDVLITNIKRSLNLHRGDVCIFYSVETNPAKVEQIACRIDRNVDDKAKHFVLLAYEGEEADFFMHTVLSRSEDGEDLTDVLSETVIKFGELLIEAA